MLNLKIELQGLPTLKTHLERLADRIENLQPFLQDVGEYMVRSTRNRILREKTSPEGVPWTELSDLTVMLKGHASILFETGDLAQGVYVSHVGDDDVEISNDEEYAGYMQRGVSSTGGRWKGQTIPARPFMGLSRANLNKVRSMLHNYIEGERVVPGED